MNTRKLIESLRRQPGNIAFDPQIRAEAADRLEQLMQLTDDIHCDHYVDYLDWYTNRCRELEDELEVQTQLAQNGQSAIDTNKQLVDKIIQLEDAYGLQKILNEEYRGIIAEQEKELSNILKFKKGE